VGKISTVSTTNVTKAIPHLDRRSNRIGFCCPNGIGILFTLPWNSADGNRCAPFVGLQRLGRHGLAANY